MANAKSWRSNRRSFATSTSNTVTLPRRIALHTTVPEWQTNLSGKSVVTSCRRQGCGKGERTSNSIIEERTNYQRGNRPAQSLDYQCWHTWFRQCRYGWRKYRVRYPASFVHYISRPEITSSREATFDPIHKIDRSGCPVVELMDKSKAIETINRMLGYNAPDKTEHTGKDGNSIEINTTMDYSGLSNADLLAAHALIHKATNGKSDK